MDSNTLNDISLQSNLPLQRNPKQSTHYLSTPHQQPIPINIQTHAMKLQNQKLQQQLTRLIDKINIYTQTLHLKDNQIVNLEQQLISRKFNIQIQSNKVKKLYQSIQEITYKCMTKQNKIHTIQQRITMEHLIGTQQAQTTKELLRRIHHLQSQIQQREGKHHNQMGKRKLLDKLKSTNQQYLNKYQQMNSQFNSLMQTLKISLYDKIKTNIEQSQIILQKKQIHIQQLRQLIHQLPNNQYTGSIRQQLKKQKKQLSKLKKQQLLLMKQIQDANQKIRQHQHSLKFKIKQISKLNQNLSKSNISYYSGNYSDQKISQLIIKDISINQKSSRKNGTIRSSRNKSEKEQSQHLQIQSQMESLIQQYQNVKSKYKIL